MNPVEIGTSTPRRICLVAFEFKGYICHGGLGVFMAMMSRELMKRGHEVHAIIFADFGPAEGDLPLEMPEEIAEWTCPINNVAIRRRSFVSTTQAGVHMHSVYVAAATLFSVSDKCDAENGQVFPLKTRNAISACNYTAHYLSTDPAWQDSIVISNDDLCAMLPLFLERNARRAVAEPALSLPANDTHRKQTRVHIVHNFESGYRYKLHGDQEKELLRYLAMEDAFADMGPFRLSNADPDEHSCNLTALATQFVERWGTVSPSYRESMMARFLPRLPAHLRHKAFGIVNGIARDNFAPMMAHEKQTAKSQVILRYFPNDSVRHVNDVVLFCFVGRITHQKGILNFLYQLKDWANKSDQQERRYWTDRARFLFIGNTNTHEEEYTKRCREEEYYINVACSRKVVHCEFGRFFDARHVFAAADYALVPSLYEPCGIVQQEFLFHYAPVIATRTGGLQDTVRHWESITKTGNGFLFSNWSDVRPILSYCISLKLHEPNLYRCLTNNAKSSVVYTSTMVDQYFDLIGRTHSWTPQERVIDETLMPMHNNPNNKVINVINTLNAI